MIACGGVTAFGAFTVVPPRIEFQGIPGETYTDTITVINLGDTEEEILDDHRTALDSIERLIISKS